MINEKEHIVHNNPDISPLYNIDNPVIGLDLDGVISKTRKTINNKIEDIYNTSITDNMHTSRNNKITKIGKSYGDLIEEMVTYNTDLYYDVQPHKGSIDAIKSLSDKYKIKLITHRVHENWLNPKKRDEIKDISIEWLDTHNIPYDEFVYPTPQDKSNVQADLYIDDGSHNIQNVINAGKIGILYLTDYNKNNIPVDSWIVQSDKIDVCNNSEYQWNKIVEVLQ